MTKIIVIISSIIVGLVVIAGGAFVYTTNQSNEAKQAKSAINSQTASQAETSASSKNSSKQQDSATTNSSETSKQGAYVTLAEYNNDPSKYSDSKKVYFFHAGWCSICQAIDKEITADVSKIPAGVVLIKTDFDSSTAVRQKYGVTTQYTFVQVDNNGTETNQWTATSLSKAISGIQ